MNRNPKTSLIKSIVCQEHLWNALNEESRDSGHSVDYLVNEAIRCYLSSYTSRIISTETLPIGFSRTELGLDQEPSQPRTTLFLWFNHRREIIQKDVYYIGREAANLVINDNNVSRRHCKIIYTNGEYHIEDVDSKNGLDFDGRKVRNKRIEEGDCFKICHHEIRFTYQDSVDFTEV
jgi:hypothetical protein